MNEFIKEFEDFVKSDVRFSNKYCVQYMDLDSYYKILEIALKFRFQNKITVKDYELIKKLIRMIYENYLKYNLKVKKVNHSERKKAQSFIGRKNIRLFIFNRDKVCLSCGSNENLSIDHIKAVVKGGGNKISNLQTLCKSCNSKKGYKYIDYRK